MSPKSYFEPVDPKVNFPEMEERIIKTWKDQNVFKRSVDSRPKNKTWTFLDGPPFITGLPHYGTLLSSIPKDVFPRYWTMKGHSVRRVWGWDCHGLPAENKVENKLGIERKKDIEGKVGVKKFIDECKLYVNRVSSEWEWYVDHIGRWVDFRNAYKTMDLPYMESVMWVFKQMYNKGYIYKGLRVSLYCPHCVTPISNFEVAMDADNYKDVEDVSTTYKYKLKGETNTYLLAWSTTPWNKIVTPALAVNPDLTYIEVEQAGEHLILAETTQGMLLPSPATRILRRFVGSELVGREFELHYDFYSIEPGKRAGVVIAGDFVTAEEGTGIVTIAAYGEEDLKVMQDEDIQIYLHVDEEGNVKKEVPLFGGKYYLDVNEEVDVDLERRGLIYSKAKYVHSMPHCWRCHTRLFYAPQSAWFVDIQKLRPAMKKNNEVVNWFPGHFKYGRFLKSMEAAPDWCISRSRYWGSPVPVWECQDCNERIVTGSIKEIEDLSGRKLEDLHKPEIDDVTFKCPKCGGIAKRVSEVLDSWIEAGSASYAERHYPFDKELKLEEFFPPDFIVEYTGQIRAWFYVLHVIATALFDSNAFKNVLVSGVILGTDGRKMSKNYGNYPDPKEMLLKYGGDALRLYLLGSPVMHGEDIRISEEEYRNQVKNFLMIYWNIYNFFVTNANADGWKPGNKLSPSHVLDSWILSRMYGSIKNLVNAYETYNTPEIVGLAYVFVIKDLSLWYVRRIRSRVGPSAEDGTDKNDAYQTLWTVLTQYSKALAPLLPFVTEEIFRNLTKKDSIHLEDWTNIDKRFYKPELEIEMENARKVVEMVLGQRKEAGIPVRQTLAGLATTSPVALSQSTLNVLAQEVNVLDIKNKQGKLSAELDLKITPELEESGRVRDLVRKIQEGRKKLGVSLDARVSVETPWLPKDLKDVEMISQKTLADIVVGSEFKVTLKE